MQVVLVLEMRRGAASDEVLAFTNALPPLELSFESHQSCQTNQHYHPSVCPVIFFQKIQTMKLIVAGASGFVGTEVLRQSLNVPKITSVIALARRPVPIPAGLDSGAKASKLISVALENYDKYSDDVKKQLAGANACIWYVIIS